MPEMRSETFTHPEKTAMTREAAIKKANVALFVAARMLPKNATDEALDAQAFTLMETMPDAALIETYNRLAGDVEACGEPMAQGQQQTVQAEQVQQALASGDMQAAQQLLSQLMQQQGQGGQQAVQANQGQQDQGQQEQKQATAPAAVPAVLAAPAPAAPPVAAPAAPAPVMTPDAVAAMVTAAVKRAMGELLAQQPQQQVQAQPQQQQAPMAQQPQEQLSDDQMLDTMLASPCDGMDDEIPVDFGDMGDGVVMEPPQMDVDDTQLGPEDDELQAIFSSNEEVRNAQQVVDQQGDGQQQAQQKQASQHGARTASRVGTRPPGVSRLGGSPAPSAASRRDASVDELSKLWQTAPDVSEVFGNRSSY